MHNAGAYSKWLGNLSQALNAQQLSRILQLQLTVFLSYLVSLDFPYFVTVSVVTFLPVYRP